MAAFNLIEQICGFAFEPPLEAIGWKRMMSGQRRPCRTADGYACLLPYSDQNWRDFFAHIGQPALADDPRFRDHPSRIDNTDALYALVHQAAVRFTTAEWIDFCERKAIPAMPVNELASLWDDRHLVESGVVGFAEHPTEGRYRTIGSPVMFSATPATMRSHAPHPGEQTEEILRELGFDEAEIDRLIREKAAFRQEPLTAAR
jgi:crotonobetainyl-CoA:carnitine CoA-transferase CaiB-like acyl-CoA transferase